MKKFILAILSLTILGCPLFSFAESLPMKNGRYDGPVLIMQLTAEQSGLLKKSYEPYKQIKLSKDQQALVSRDTGMKNPPTKLEIIRPEDAAKDCTCGLANFGLLIGENTIELPTGYIVTDQQAAAKKIID